MAAQNIYVNTVRGELLLDRVSVAVTKIKPHKNTIKLFLLRDFSTQNLLGRECLRTREEVESERQERDREKG